jgi:hypothetical protein
LSITVNYDVFSFFFFSFIDILFVVYCVLDCR